MKSRPMSRPVHSSNAAALWWSSIWSPFMTAASAGHDLASRSSRVSLGVVEQVEHHQVRAAAARSGMGVSIAVEGRPIELALTSSLALISSASMTDSCHGIARSSMCAALRKGSGGPGPRPGGGAG